MYRTKAFQTQPVYLREEQTYLLLKYEFNVSVFNTWICCED